MIGPRENFQIQRKIDISDGAGGYFSTWTDIANIKGSLIKKSGWEKFISDSVRNATTYTFMMKYRGDLNITIKDRIRKENVVYEIIEHPEDPALKHRFLLMVLRRVD
ncbi:MAG: head-tail adaptor protein [Candidatus Doudnabacteria bacterium]